jgi:hypothetical protein
MIMPMINEGGHAYRQEQLAAIIGKSQPAISKSLSINRFPKEIIDKCRQDPIVPKTILVEIARKKQGRSLLIQFRRYQDHQAKAAAKDTEAAAPVERKRTSAEAIANSIGNMAAKIGDLEFPDFSKKGRASIIDGMNSLKEALVEAITRAMKNKKKPM